MSHRRSQHFSQRKDSESDPRYRVCGRTANANSGRPRWWSQPAACRFRKSAQPRSATISRANSASRFASRGRDLSRWFSKPRIVPVTATLSGVSADVIASCEGQQFREKMLITHRGLSGPAILQISSYWKKPQPIQIDLAPGERIHAVFHDPKAPRTLTALRAEFRKVLPARFADRWLELHAPASWTNVALADFERQAHAWAITPAGTEGFEKAEVTAAASTPTNFPPRPWRAAKSLAYSSSAKSST